MFDIFDDQFADVLREHFDVLEEGYVRDKADDILEIMQADFDRIFESRYLLVRSATGQPAYGSLFDRRDAAEGFRQSLQCPEDVTVCVVLVDK